MSSDYAPHDGKDVLMKNRKMRRLRICLGIEQMKEKPILDILFLMILIFAVILWIVKDRILTMFDVPDILLPIWKGSVYLFLAMIPIFSLIFLLEVIGNMTAQKDENALARAFDSYDLRNGSPILMSKKRIKGTKVIRREFYSSIPMETWEKKKDYIADCMSVHFVEPLQYGGNEGGRIVMYTAKGREPIPRGVMYDDEH